VNHKRKRPRTQRAGCWCKAGKKLGRHELRGGKFVGYAIGHGGRMAQLAERARDVAGLSA